MTGVYTAPGPQGWGVYEVAFKDGQPEFRPANREPEGYCIPGFVDLHIHGAYDIDFMSAGPGDMAKLADRLGEEGYAGFLPTTITASASDIRSALDNLPQHPLIWGFHLEGPFLSPQFPGAQPPSSIVPPPTGPSEWDAILDDPRLRLITLAPEIPGALELTARLAARGVIVSAGHTDATGNQVSRAVSAGLSHATHTFNAMRGLHHREPGTVGAVLTQDPITAELIYDGHHVSRAAADVLLRCKPVNRVVAVSDCTKAKGLPAGAEFDMWGHKAIKGDSDVRLKDSGALAGSCATLADCFRNIAADFGVETATRICCLNPLSELKMSLPPKWIVLDNDLDLQHLA